MRPRRIHTPLVLTPRQQAERRIGAAAAAALDEGSKPEHVARAKAVAFAKFDEQDHEDRRCLTCGQRSAKLLCPSCSRESIEQARSLRA